MEPQVVVGAAVIDAGRVLTTQRTEPAHLAGQWEFPGGKVEPGETEREALVRECDEELGLQLDVGARVGPEVSVAGGRFLLRVYACRVRSGALRLTEHSDHRWLGPDELHTVAWIEADEPVVAAVADLLRA